MENSVLFPLTQLAEASYAFYEKFALYKDALKNKGFSDTQAASLLSQWSVSSHQKNTENGFSATLFRSKDPSTPDEYVLALRGTEQFIVDLSITDGLDIVRDGLAMDQVVDMYNYWQQLKTPKGSAYQVAILETDYTLTAAYAAAIAGGPLAVLAYREYLQSRTDIVIDEPLGKVRKINFNYQSNQVFNDERSAGLGIAPSS